MTVFDPQNELHVSCLPFVPETAPSTNLSVAHLFCCRAANDIDRYVLCAVPCVKQCSKACQYMVNLTKQRHWNHQQRRKMDSRVDWICKSCQQSNFCWRESCRRCLEPRPEGSDGDGGLHRRSNIYSFASAPRVSNFRPGDWFCNVATCRGHNFACRWNCFKCGAIKNAPSFGGGGFPNHVFHAMSFDSRRRRGGRVSRRGWEPGDWFCSRADCSAHNYATRMKCYKCRTPKESLSNLSY